MSGALPGANIALSTFTWTFVEAVRLLKNFLSSSDAHFPPPPRESFRSVSSFPLIARVCRSNLLPFLNHEK